MGAVLFTCPIKRAKAQGWVADDVPKDRAFGGYVSVDCPACGLAHYVNPKTGKRLGEEK